MALVLTDDQNYINIANSIRAKTGKATEYYPSEMSSAIDNIVIPDTLVTENGDTTAIEKTEIENVIKAVGGLGNAIDSEVLSGVTYTSDNGIKRTGTFVPSDSGIQSDWDQTDETAMDYIKNKPNFEDLQTTVAQKTQVQIITWGVDD